MEASLPHEMERSVKGRRQSETFVGVDEGLEDEETSSYRDYMHRGLWSLLLETVCPSCDRLSWEMDCLKKHSFLG